MKPRKVKATGSRGHGSPSAGLTALAAVAAITALAAVPGGPAHAAAKTGPGRAAKATRAGTHLVTETFTRTTAPEFTGYNEACLTGAPEGRPPAGDHSLGGCEPTEAGPVPPLDAAPYGYLRLTDAGYNRSAAVLYNHALPASEGLDVTFSTWQYGHNPNDGPPADGISFFLTDGEASLTKPGAFGGSLGYAKKQPTPTIDPNGPFIEGVADGYLGVGLDVLGNYFADTEQRGHSCGLQPSPAGIPTMDGDFYERGPNMITLRGPGNGIDGYCYITATTDYPHRVPSSRPWPSNLPVDLQGPTTSLPAGVSPREAQDLLEVDRREVNVRVTPTPDPRVIVSIDPTGTWHQVLDVPAPTPIPPTYRFGLAASTGHFNDVHLIRNVVVATDRPLPRLSLVKQVQEPRPGHLTTGDQVHYEFVVTNAGDAPITGLVVHDPVVGPVSCPKAALTVDQTVTCTATYTVTAADVARGFIDNTAVATGEASASAGGVTSEPSDWHVELVEPPSLDLEKLIGTAGPFHAGQAVRYTYLVANTGGLALDDVHVSDDRVTAITCAATTLAPAGSPGDHTTCHGTYAITAADARRGLVTNTAVASGREDGQTITSPKAQQTLLIGPPHLTIRKTMVTKGPFFKGSAVRYEYVVTNTGPRTLHAVAVVDDRVAKVACGRTTLAPGQGTTCYGTYLITGLDVTRRRVTNIAQAGGTDPDGNMLVSDLVRHTIPVARATPVTG